MNWLPLATERVTNADELAQLRCSSEAMRKWTSSYMEGKREAVKIVVSPVADCPGEADFAFHAYVYCKKHVTGEGKQ